MSDGIRKRASQAQDKSECSSLKQLSINSNEEDLCQNENSRDTRDGEHSNNDLEDQISEQKSEEKSCIFPSPPKLAVKIEKSSMMEWVTVVSDEGDEPIEIPTENDGTMLLSSLTALFPGVTGIKFRNPTTNNLRVVRIHENVLYPPNPEGWGYNTYICTRSSGVLSKGSKKGDLAMKRKFENDPDGLLSKNQRVDEIDEDYDMGEETEDSGTCDLIVLGLPYSASEDDVRNYFEEFGELMMIQLKKNRSGTSKGFAFIRFKDVEVQDKVLLTRHMINERWCNVKIPDSQELKASIADASCKIFVARLPESVTSEDLKEHFETFGTVTDVYIPKPHRNFAFVTFSEPRIAQSLFWRDHLVKGKKVQIHPAEPRGSSEGSSRGRDRGKNRGSWDMTSRGNGQMSGWRGNYEMGYRPYEGRYAGSNSHGASGGFEDHMGGYIRPWYNDSDGTERYNRGQIQRQ